MTEHIPEEHTGSWYAASVNDDTRYPQLQGTHRADVCVIGAGFTGVSTALTLAERGRSVCLLEANRVGWGASGRNGGQLIGGISGEQRLVRQYGPGIAGLVWHMRWAGHDIIRQRVDTYAIQCDWKPGYIDVAIKPRHMQALEEDYEELQEQAFPHKYRLVDQAWIGENLGTRAYIGGLVNMGNGHLHPLNLCLGEARAAVGLGVRIHEQSPVTRIEHGAKPRAITTHGQVLADHIVIAANAYNHLEQKTLGGVVFPAGSFIIATEPLDGGTVAEVNPLDLAVCDPNHVLDYYRLSADKRMLFGGRCNYSGRVPASIQASIRPRMLKIYPRLKDVKIAYEWGGNIGIVINRVPHLGCINNNVYYCQGYSGHGVNVTHLMGDILADVVTGTSERFDVFAQVRHFAIPGSRWFGNQLVALGMMYFRLRDIL